MTQKRGQRLSEVGFYKKDSLEGDHRYRTRNLPAAGSKKPVGTAEQEQIIETIHRHMESRER